MEGKKRRGFLLQRRKIHHVRFIDPLAFAGHGATGDYYIAKVDLKSLNPLALSGHGATSS